MDDHRQLSQVKIKTSSKSSELVILGYLCFRSRNFSLGEKIVIRDLLYSSSAHFVPKRLNSAHPNLHFMIPNKTGTTLPQFVGLNN